MPSSTPKQALAMRIAAHGKSNIGIPAKVGKDFEKADRAKANALRKLPYKKPKNSLTRIMTRA